MARIRFHKRPACGAPFAIARGFGNARGVHAKRTPFRFHIGLSVWFSGARIYGSAFSAFLPAAMRGTIVPVRETAPQISNTKATSEVKGGPFCVIPVLLAGCAAVAVGWGQKSGAALFSTRLPPMPPVPIEQALEEPRTRRLHGLARCADGNTRRNLLSI